MRYSSKLHRFWLVAVALAVALSVAACGGDDGGGDDTAAPADDTAAPADDDMTEAETDEPVDAAPDFSAAAGSYTGSWTNTTFGSTGGATFDVTIEGDTFTATIDLAGGVFGEGDPDPFTVEGTLSADGGAASGTSDLLGSYTLMVTADGAFALEATDVPSERIATFSAAGTIAVGTIGGTYSVTFEDGGDAEGTFELTRGA